MRERPTICFCTDSVVLISTTLSVQKHIVIPVDGKTECIVIKIVLCLYVFKCVAFSVPIRHKDIRGPLLDSQGEGGQE